MSHITKIEVEIKDLDALRLAAEYLGMELRIGQKTYDWYGRSVGDSVLPEGFTVADLGKCDHALTIPGNDRAYEVGVVARRDGQEGFNLLLDTWQGGYGLEEKIGANGKRLVQEYSVQVGIKHATMEGCAVSREMREDGHIFLRAIQ